MVIIRPIHILLTLLLSFSAWAQEANIAVDINQGPIYSNQPVGGLISVTHLTASPVDTSSFKLGQSQLSVNLVKEVPVGTASTLSIYRFQAPGKPSGLYVLSPISVTINGISYNSPLTSYEVKSGGSNQTPAPAAQSPTTQQPSNATPPPPQASLQLSAYVDGPSSIYPGQRTKLAYKIAYVGDIDLKEEMLPLLKPEGLRKIGDIDTEEEEQGNASILIVTQLVEGIKPGKFTYGPSIVNGVAYVQAPGGSKAYLSPPLKSEAPPVTLTVLPFPNADKPASFNGAIGPLKMDVKLISPSKVNVGDKITIQINLTGNVILENVQPPDVCCQPGFSGLFKTNELPPPTTIKGNTKSFNIDLWPLSKEIKDIPSIEYAYFNPKSAKYEVLKSHPIPISVQPAVQPPEKPLKKEENGNVKETGPIKPSPIEIQTIYPLQCSDLHNAWFGTWDVLILLPLGAILLLFQNTLHDALERHRKRVKIKTSQELLKETAGQINDPKTFFPLLNQTMVTWLKEKGEIPPSDALPEPESLPETGLAGDIRKFLSKIQEKRFTGNDDLIPRQDILKEAKQFMSNGRRGK